MLLRSSTHRWGRGQGVGLSQSRDAVDVGVVVGEAVEVGLLLPGVAAQDVPVVHDCPPRRGEQQEEGQ